MLSILYPITSRDCRGREWSISFSTHGCGSVIQRLSEQVPSFPVFTCHLKFEQVGSGRENMHSQDWRCNLGGELLCGGGEDFGVSVDVGGGGRRRHEGHVVEGGE